MTGSASKPSKPVGLVGGIGKEQGVKSGMSLPDCEVGRGKERARKATSEGPSVLAVAIPEVASSRLGLFHPSTRD